MSIHFGMSIALQAPELQLSQDEAEQFAKSIATVARHYDMGASAKTLDWINLGTTAASIYGTRAMMVVARRKGRGRAAADRPAPNGHDAPPAEMPATGEDIVVDFSLMRGAGGMPN